MRQSESDQTLTKTPVATAVPFVLVSTNAGTGIGVDVEITGEDEGDVLCSINSVFNQAAQGNETMQLSATAGPSIEKPRA